ncbi:MAG: hypothetical protein ACOYOA_08040 [Saprospiraceae bacterium]
MQDSKLIETFRLLKDEDMSGIRNLISTDLLIKGVPKKECLLLLDYIYSYYPFLNHEKLEKKTTLALVFDDHSGKINRLEKIMSNLLSITEYYIVNFIVNKEFDTIRINLSLAKFYRQKGFMQRGDIFMKRLAEYFNDVEGMSSDHFFWEGKYLEELYDGKIFKSSNWKDSTESLSLNYEILKVSKNLEMLCKVVYSRANFDATSLSEFDNIKAILDQNEKLKSNVLIKLYYLALEMFKSIDDYPNRYYDEYENLMENNIVFINVESAKILFVFQRGYFTQKYNRNPNPVNTRENSEIYRKHLEQGHLLVNDILLPSTVVNLMMFAIKEKNSAWISDFLLRWENYIGTINEREEILNYCWLNYYFLIRNFDKAEAAISFNYSNIFYLLFTRRTRLKILYEKKEMVSLSYEADSLKVYVFRLYKRNDISEDIYIYHNNFIDFIKKICNLAPNVNEARKAKFKEKLLEKKCADKEWLTEKIDELK